MRVSHSVELQGGVLAQWEHVSLLFTSSKSVELQLRDGGILPFPQLLGVLSHRHRKGEG